MESDRRGRNPIKKAESIALLLFYSVFSDWLQSLTSGQNNQSTPQPADDSFRVN